MRFLARLFSRRPLAATIDFDDPAVARDPFPHYEALRAGGPVHFLERHGAWLVIGHDEVQWAFLHPELLSNAPYADVDAVLLGADPPDHTRMRKIVTPYFDRETVERLAAFAAERARELLRPRMDVVRDYAEPLSESVAAQLLGFDDAAVGEIRDAMRTARSFEDLMTTLRALAPRAPMYERLRGDGVDDVEARSLVALFWVASTKTTERVIAQCALHLMHDDAVRAALRDDPALLGRFADEVMRLHQPEPVLRRAARVPLELGGKSIPAGATVYLALAAANRDPARYENPNELRLDRAVSRHLSFGHGIHYCIGATLGRATVLAAVGALLQHAPEFRAAQPLESVPIVATMMAHWIASLPIETGSAGA